jgi:hypothetical protein
MTRAVTAFGLCAIIAEKALKLSAHVVVEWDATLLREEHLFKGADGAVVYKATLVGDGDGSAWAPPLPGWADEWAHAIELVAELVDRRGWWISIMAAPGGWVVNAHQPDHEQGCVRRGGAKHENGPTAVALAVARAAGGEAYEIREPAGLIASPEPVALRGEAER